MPDPTAHLEPFTGASADTCRAFAASSKLEWLETNGTGAFAMGTVSGVNTRRYHALLVASLRPPVERYVLLSHFEDQAIIGDQTFLLGASQYPGVVANRGFELLKEFLPRPHATWRYRLGDALLEKQVYLVPGKQAVVVRYRADRALTLKLRPFLAYRDYHSLAHANDSLNQGVEISPGVVRMTPYAGLPPLELFSEGAFAADPHWYRDFEHLAELERGLDFREDLFTPGVLTLAVSPDEWSHVCASIDGAEPLDAPRVRDPFVVRRADGRPTIIAGYPWFTDWGRDTMISLPGLMITHGRLLEARQIIEGFLEHAKNGIIPNRFPDAGETPEYNTADATLWMFQALRIWLEAGGDRRFLENVFYPAAKEIIHWHIQGTWYDIGVDPDDGLLRAGTPGTQLTWMDAKDGDWVVTPRDGKPVEINALWHGALSSMADWAAHMGDRQAVDEYRKSAQRVRYSFREKFWNPQRECLYDVLAPGGPIAKLRPNQIFAVSLPYDLLTIDQQKAVIRIVERELLTPVGLRTLERSDPDYRPHYQGPQGERDGAYHQGTVWPWLLGPYIDAYLLAFGQTAETLQYCRDLLTGLDHESSTRGCLGSIAEIYDGDEPREPRGCPAQAWSVAEIERVRSRYGL